MMMRDPLVLFSVDALLASRRSSGAYAAAKAYRLQTQERLDQTQQILANARQALADSSRMIFKGSAS